MRTDKDVLIKAMRKAEEAFDKELEKGGLDGSWFVLDLVGRVLYEVEYPSPEHIIRFENYEAILKQNELHNGKKNAD